MNKWIVLERWTPEEAACALLELDHFNSRNIQANDMRKAVISAAQAGTIRRDSLDINDFMNDFVRGRGKSWKLHPISVLIWATSKGIPIPASLWLLQNQQGNREYLKVQDESDSIAPQGAKKKSRGAISQKNAAALCGVSRRKLQGWEASGSTTKPADYPGRSDAGAFTMFAARLRQQKAFALETKAMAEAMPINPHKIR